MTAPSAAEQHQAEYRVAAGTDLIGESRTVQATHEDTLLDLAVDHGVGYLAMRYANPGVDIWLPGKGTKVRIPRRHILPDAPREGIVLNLPELRLYHFIPDESGGRVATYPVGIGRQDWQTPLGRSRVEQRVEHPAWYPPESVRQEAADRGESLAAVVPPGPENPLGDRALILSREGYLIHGTNKPYGIGMRVSHGCVRLHPRDIAELFSRVRPGTPVQIVDQPYKSGVRDGKLYVEVHPPLAEGASATPSAVRSLTPLVRQVMAAARQADDDLLSSVDWNRVETAYERATGMPVRVSP